MLNGCPVCQQFNAIKLSARQIGHTADLFYLLFVLQWTHRGAGVGLSCNTLARGARPAATWPGVHYPQPPGQGCTARSHLARGALPAPTWPGVHRLQPPGQGCTARSHLASGAPPAATWPGVHRYTGCSHLLKDTPAAATWPAICRPALIWTLGHTSVF